MPESFSELILNLTEHAGKAAVDHLSAKLRGLPQMPTLPPLPALPQMPTLDAAMRQPTLAAAIAPAADPLTKRDENAPPLYSHVPSGEAAGPSYAEEFGIQETPVACWPCSQRHVNTVVVTTESGAEDATPENRREAAATALGEIDVWKRYDVTAGKLDRTDPEKRAAVVAALPGMLAARAALQPPPADLHLAWAAAGEAERFLRGASPSPMEQREAEERMADVQGWIGRADTLPLPREAGPHLHALRRARHRLTREGNTHAAVLETRDALRAAAVALTPDPGPDALRTAAKHARSARSAFYRGALQAMRKEAAGAVLTSTVAPSPVRGRAYLDEDSRISESLARAYLDEAPAVPLVADALGATPETRRAFERLAAFSAARGVPVRDDPLPAEYAIEDGKVVNTGVVLGAYVPAADAIYVGTQAVVAAPKDVEMLCEEVGHALLDSDRCNIWRTDSAKVAYEDRPEEREAKLASLLAVLGAGLPLETQDGRLIPPRAARLDVAALERGENPRILLRARWAADIMVRAMRGDVAGAVAASGACPMSA